MGIAISQKHVVGCRWMHAAKFLSQRTSREIKGPLGCQRTNLLRQSFRNVLSCGSFSSRRILLSARVVNQWPLHQL